MWYFLSGERVYHFHLIIKGICDPKKVIQGLKRATRNLFYTRIGKWGQKTKNVLKKEGDILLIFSLYSYLGNKCFKLEKIIKLIKPYLKIIKATF